MCYPAAHRQVGLTVTQARPIRTQSNHLNPQVSPLRHEGRHLFRIENNVKDILMRDLSIGSDI
jgi:hypothetical protein